MSIEFRPARADDVDDAIPLIYSSGPLAFDFVFGSDRFPATEFLRRAFITGKGTFGYNNHVVGVRNGKVVATGAGYSSDTTVPYTLAVATQIVKAYRFGAVGQILTGLRIERVIKPPAKGTHYVAHLGVTPEARGTGIGSALVEHLHDQGRQLGRTVAELDVAVTNPRAQALYERLGYRVVKEEPSTLENRFGKVVDHRRMATDL